MARDGIAGGAGVEEDGQVTAVDGPAQRRDGDVAYGILTTMPAARSPSAPRIPPELEVLSAADVKPEDRLEAVELRAADDATLNAPGVTLDGGRVSGRLGGARLAGLHLRDAEVHEADLANADLRGAGLNDVTVRGGRLTGVRLQEASLRDVTFVDCRADLLVLASARLQRVCFTGCDLREATFEDCALQDICFTACDLSGATFTRARLQRVELVGCTLDGVRSLADLRGAAMPWPDVVANAGALAAALGIEVLHEDEG
jgi:uncharacterized protein YjbI with pentapeptide repeats